MVASDTHNGPACDGWFGKRHFIATDVSVVRIVAVEFTTAVAFAAGLVLDGQPIASCAVVTLIPVKAVVSAERDQSIVHRHRTTKELDAVVEVGNHLHVVDGRSGPHTCEGQAIDFVGCTELGSTVTDADVGDDTAVVSVVLSAVRGEVVVRGDALNLGGTAEVGGGVTQYNQTSPLAARIVRD